MILTPAVLKRLMFFLREERAQQYAPLLNETCDRFHINTYHRQAAFLAQIAHESGDLRFTKELASGEAYDTGTKAKRLGNTPQADGDGQKYKGRGLIQITGLDNYRACGEYFGWDLINHPELLEQPREASLSAGWFWDRNKLNVLADMGDFNGITKRINGGLTGQPKRLLYWTIAKNVLKEDINGHDHENQQSGT